MVEQITLGRYLFERLRELGIESVFGVPGDFNLSLLDKVYEAKLRWVGDANELNAAYSADGYARVKRFAAVVTTFGVGELSAINGIAGSYAEQVPVLHIVGMPAQSAQNQKLLLHHTLGTGDFQVYYRMSKEVSVSHAFLSFPQNAVDEIDRVIRETYILCRPGYLALSTNLFNHMVDASLLEKKLDLSIPPNNSETEKECLDQIMDLVSRAKNPIIIVDGCADRHRCEAEVAKLIEVTKFPVYTTPMGKGIVNEGGVDATEGGKSEDLIQRVIDRLEDKSSSRFGGVYFGALSTPEVKEAVENADLVLSVGSLKSDLNTGSFSYGIKSNKTIEVHSNYTSIKRATYNELYMKQTLQALNKRIGEYVKNYQIQPVPKIRLANTPLTGDQPLNMKWFWTRMSTFFRTKDIVIAETGTSTFGYASTRFPDHVTGITQVLYGSIGYSVGSLVGAALAGLETDASRRVLLYVGDGSLQLTAQAIGTIIRNKLNPFIFIMNNNGYTIERLIHGETAQYNDIQPWKYTQLPETFGAEPGTYETYQIRTVNEANKLLDDKEFGNPGKLKVIEVFTSELDAPETLLEEAKLMEKTNNS